MKLSIMAQAAVVAIVIGQSASVAHAQAATPPENKSRLICRSFSSLVKAVEMLPYAQAVEKPDAIPDAAAQIDKKTGEPNCAWAGPKSKLPDTLPLGWLYAGSYTVLVGAFKDLTNNQTWIRPLVVVRKDEWRLEDHCAQSSPFIRTSVEGADSMSLFGSRVRTGFDPSCRNLVNRKIEADQLNAPPVIYSEAWRSRPQRRTIIGCMTLEALANALDPIVNEMQVINSDQMTFRKTGCTFRPVDEIVASRFLGIYTTEPASPGGRRFGVDIHEVVYYSKQFKTLTTLLMPSHARRTEMVRRTPECQMPVRIPHRGQRNIMLTGTRLGDVAAANIQTPGGQQLLQPITYTAVGNERCETVTEVFGRPPTPRF